MNKKVLLLSCNTGEGHHSAALAVQEALLAQGAQAELADPLSFASESVRQNATELYNSMIRNAPKAFGVVYRLGEAVSSITKHSPIYIANSLYAENLLRYILENSFDAVVSTHLYGMEACTALRQRQKLPVPAYGVLTDYTAIPFFHETRLNGYFVPHRDLIAELTATGMDASLLHPTGIPVSPRFAQHMPKEQAREHLSLPAGKRIYLVMTGGVGCGNIAALCDGLLTDDSSDFLALVLTGKNDKLREELTARYAGDHRVQAVPFTREVNLYMNASDVLITKPGGLSSTEAAAACIPMIHLITIPGCEEKNAAFYESHGMARKTTSLREAASLAVALAGDPAACEAMRKQQAEQINANSAQDIARFVLCANANDD